MINALPIQFSASLNIFFLPFWILACHPLILYLPAFDIIIINNELWPVMFYHHFFGRIRILFFLALDIRVSFFRLYVNCSAWHNIFIILYSFLDHNKCCRNYAEFGSKCPKRPKSSSRPQNGHSREKNNTPLIGLLILIYGWQIYKEVIYRPVKPFFKCSTLEKLSLAKKFPD